MAPRPYWKGYLKLSLVSCAVSLYPATSSSERVSFRQINKQTGNRLRQQLVDEVTREPVETADKGRGYEVGKNTYIEIEDEEVEAIEVESTHTIEIDSFVPMAQIDDRFRDSPYDLAPNDAVSQEAFAVIREAMKARGVVGLGRIVLSKRERPIILEPFGKGIRGMTLRYPYEVRNEDEYFSEIPDLKIPGEMLKLAEHIIDSKAADFEPQLFVDHYEEALVEMLKKKQAGFAVPKNAPAAPAYTKTGNVIELLKLSLKNANADNAPTKGKSKKAQAKLEEARKAPQFKLPIKGGKTKQVEKAAKPVPATKSAGRKSA
jgi:DNA end-binding protein Ku